MKFTHIVEVATRTGNIDASASRAEDGTIEVRVTGRGSRDELKTRGRCRHGSVAAAIAVVESDVIAWDLERPEEVRAMLRELQYTTEDMLAAEEATASE